MQIRRDIYRALSLFAGPLRRQRGRSGIVIRAYRGFGSRSEICLFGRVFWQSKVPAPSGEREGFLRQLRLIWRRIWRRGLRNAPIRASFAGSEQTAWSDRFGFFFLRLPLRHPPAVPKLWHRASLEVSNPALEAERVETELFIPTERARFVVISDIDDTVVFTGVINKVNMMWNLFFTRAHSRVAFPGVGALYRALHRGVSGDQHNPMIYVSRGPWSIYEVLETFFHLHAIPAGPVLFLRYWGMTLDHPLPRRARNHKWDIIGHILAVYRDLPFILIGDSGQKDPEVYARVVRENPGRVLAVYIRNIGSQPERVESIARLAEETARAGAALVLADDSLAMAEDAVRRGLIGSEALDEIVAAHEAR